MLKLEICRPDKLSCFLAGNLFIPLKNSPEDWLFVNAECKIFFSSPLRVLQWGTDALLQNTCCSF